MKDFVSSVFFFKFAAAKNKCWQSNLDVESNHNLSRTRILPLDHQDLLELKQIFYGDNFI